MKIKKTEIAETETAEQAIRDKLTEINEYFSKLKPGDPFNPWLMRLAVNLEDWLYIYEIITEKAPEIMKLPLKTFQAKMPEDSEKKYTIEQLRKAWGAGRYAAESD